MSDIVGFAERILKWLQDHDRPVVRLLRKGLTDRQLELAQDYLGLSLPKEAIELLKWRNGVSYDRDPGTKIGDLRFLPGYFPVSMAGAIQEIEVHSDLESWQSQWFPVFENGGGASNDYLLLDLAASDGNVAPVIGISLVPEDACVEFKSLTSMMEIKAECFERGVFFIDEDGYIESDLEGEKAVVEEFHPEGVPPWWRDA